jgi:hypothetical protein
MTVLGNFQSFPHIPDQVAPDGGLQVRECPRPDSFVFRDYGCTELAAETTDTDLKNRFTDLAAKWTATCDRLRGCKGA